MKKVFALYLNGEFLQYLKPSEIHLLKWDNTKIYQLKSVKITKEDYFYSFN